MPSQPQQFKSENSIQGKKQQDYMSFVVLNMFQQKWRCMDSWDTGVGSWVHNANQSGQRPEHLSTASCLHVTHSCHAPWHLQGVSLTQGFILRDRQSYCFFGVGRYRHRVWQAPILQEGLSQVPSQHLTAEVTSRRCPHSVSEATGQSWPLAENQKASKDTAQMKTWS